MKSTVHHQDFNEDEYLANQIEENFNTQSITTMKFTPLGRPIDSTAQTFMDDHNYNQEDIVKLLPDVCPTSKDIDGAIEEVAETAKKLLKLYLKYISPDTETVFETTGEIVEERFVGKWVNKK